MTTQATIANLLHQANQPNANGYSHVLETFYFDNANYLKSFSGYSPETAAALAELGSRDVLNVIRSSPGRYTYEFAFLLYQLGLLQHNLPLENHPSFAPLKEILENAIQIANKIGQTNAEMGLEARRIQKISALKTVIERARDVAIDPVSVAANQALVKATEKMRPQIEGYYLFTRREPRNWSYSWWSRLHC